MAREFSRSLYSSREWKKCREGYMKSVHFICERCGAVAIILHHKTYVTPLNVNDHNITLNWDNLQALCIECHNVTHGRSKPTVEGVAFDADGNLIQTI